MLTPCACYTIGMRSRLHRILCHRGFPVPPGSRAPCQGAPPAAAPEASANEGDHELRGNAGAAMLVLEATPAPAAPDT